jgi:ribosomal protein S18 acetylase RimI-like enzyme
MSVTDEADYLQQGINNPAAVLLLAIDDGQLVGSLLGTFDGWRGHMYRLVVHASHRRQGLGRELVARVERVLRDSGAKRVVCLIEVDRPWATDFWSAVGYGRNDHIVHVGVLE